MMMTENFKAHSMMQAFLDKGLQSQSIADVLTTVTECARCIREYPFPAFVSSTLHRLAQAFQGEIFGRRFEQSLNIIRLRIVTAVKECNDSLALNFSSDAIVRLIMKVSHSNDFKARSLTLLLLGSLAPLIFEDKKVHNLIIESLNCMETAELAAAINAAIDMSKHSHSFSALIVPKIAEMMDRSQLSNSMKMELFGIVSNLRDFSVTRNCIELGKALLLTSPDPKMHTVVYCSLTQLVARNETMFPDQIGLLISELDKVASQDNKALAHSILLNLTILANNQSRWNRAQIEAIRDFYPKLPASKGILCNWLHCLEVLSSANVHNYIFIESHPWSQLLSSDDIVTRIFAIKLAHNLLQTGQTSIDFREAFLLSISSTLCHFIDSRRVPQSRILGQLRHEFLVIVSAFVRSTQCSPEFAFSLGKSILRAELRESSKELFELLAVITDSNWAQCQEIVFSTLFAALDAVQNLVQVPAIVFTLLLATSPATLFETNESARRLADFAGRLLSQPQIEHWNLYLVARSALRYGHWKSVALPLLERVRGSCENMETESWLSGLVHICTAQPTAFTVDQLADCESHLQLAALNFTLLNSTEKNQPFGFATDYVTCLGSTGTAIRQLLVMMNVKLCSFRSTAAAVKATQLQRKSIVQSLNAVKNSIVDAKQRWVTLCSKSFDADTQTLLQMALMTRMCLLLEQFVGFLCSDPQKKEQQKLSEIPLEDLGECTQQANFKPSAQTQNFHALLIWARGELLLAQQQQAAEPNILANLELFQAILRHLVDFPLGLPRFFFQRVQRTRIKLIITPQPQDDRPVFRVSSTELLPVIIEGIIESDNPKSIESVCVVLTLKRDNAAATEKKQMIQLEPAQKYFRAQFLLKISHQRTKVSAKVWFVDAVTKKQWFDESDSATLIVELMDGAGAQQTLTG